MIATAALMKGVRDRSSDRDKRGHMTTNWSLLRILRARNAGRYARRRKNLLSVLVEHQGNSLATPR